MQEFQSIIYGGTNLGVVQQVERGIWDAEVGGSSPFTQTKESNSNRQNARQVAQWVRALDFTKRFEFESQPTESLQIPFLHGGRSSVGRVPDCGSEGHGFESHLPPKNI